MPSYTTLGIRFGGGGGGRGGLQLVQFPAIGRYDQKVPQTFLIPGLEKKRRKKQRVRSGRLAAWG